MPGDVRLSQAPLPSATWLPSTAPQPPSSHPASRRAARGWRSVSAMASAAATSPQAAAGGSRSAPAPSHCPSPPSAAQVAAASRQ